MILVIDDNAGFRRTLCNILGRAGYEVKVAATAEHGLAMLVADQPWDLALIDYRLDGPVDGIELARQARQKGIETKFLLISGVEPPGDACKDFEEVIGKPILATALVEIINRYTGQVGTVALSREISDAAAAAGIEVPPVLGDSKDEENPPQGERAAGFPS